MGADLKCPEYRLDSFCTSAVSYYGVGQNLYNMASNASLVSSGKPSRLKRKSPSSIRVRTYRGRMQLPTVVTGVKLWRDHRWADPRKVSVLSLPHLLQAMVDSACMQVDFPYLYSETRYRTHS